MIDEEFIDRLQVARNYAGIAFVITSGYRCPEHNRKVAKVEKSAHTKGMAADIAATNSRERFWINYGLIKAGFTRIGFSFDDLFIHADADPDKPEEVIWGY